MPIEMQAPESVRPKGVRPFFQGRDLLCFSHDWNSDPLSKTHLMRLLAKANRVLWVNSIGYRVPSATTADVRRALNKLMAARKPVHNPIDNLYVLNPLVVPIYGNSWVRGLNARWLRRQVLQAIDRLGFRNPINWVFNPAAAVVAGRLQEDVIIYYCVDEYAAFSGVSAGALAAMEVDLLRRADLVFVSSERLLHSKSRLNDRAVLIRHGVDHAHFASALQEHTVIPSDVAALPRPVIGYFGLMHRDWIDLDLLVEVAKRFHTGSLVLLGKVAMDLGQLSRFPNVHVLGRKPYATLPAYCKAFDVGLIPFPISDVTLNANPMKAREYLAAGLPVVSTAIPEVEVLPHCCVARTHSEFLDGINRALVEPGPHRCRSDSVVTESWQARLADVDEHVKSYYDSRSICLDL